MNTKQLTAVIPSERQIAWQQTEFYGFIHFGINTMTNREWGLGDEDPFLFNPENLVADLWVEQLKAAQMRGVILTCKHHDGFCLWPSQTTNYSVASTPWKNGQGDLVKDVARACHKHGLKFGVYLSPWDRHEACYGSGKAYDDFYIAQLTELLTQYGEIFSVWLDGANGEGPNGKKQTYDWGRYYKTIRRLQPNAVISVCGPDVRWCGNEAGQTREKEWSVVPIELQDAEKIAEHSQQVDDGQFSRKVTSGDEDLGSRTVLANYQGKLVWYPAEVNTSIRPGWFYHETEDEQVRSVEELYQIYLRSVGGNATFLLNLPPTPQGELHPKDVSVLKALGEKICQLQDQTTLQRATLSYSSSLKPVSLADLLQDQGATWQSEATDTKPYLQVTWSTPQNLSRIQLQEDIRQSQRIEAFSVYYYHNYQWKKWGEGGIVGYKKILELPIVNTTGIKVIFQAYREFPTIKQINLN